MYNILGVNVVCEFRHGLLKLLKVVLVVRCLGHSQLEQLMNYAKSRIHDTLIIQYLKVVFKPSIFM